LESASKLHLQPILPAGECYTEISIPLSSRCVIQQIEGNILGIKPSQRKTLERTYRRRVLPQQVASPDLLRHLAAISKELGRQVGVLLSRDGAVRSVIVGDATHLVIPEIGRLRGKAGRFRGLRLIHTHLRGEDLTQDDLSDLTLLRLDLIAAVRVEGEAEGVPGAIEIAHILPSTDASSEKQEPFRRIRARDIFSLDFDCELEIRALESEFSRMSGGKAGERGKERALIIGISPEPESVEETQELAESAGVEIAGIIQQRGRKIHPSTVVGRGKLQQIVLEGMRRGADVAIFDIDLKPAQARAFEDNTGLKAVDRTQLILDIFAQRARSGDGKLQVELAQLKYSLPRLTDKDAGLSRLTGGIGGRGPGETVLEIGRRRTYDRIRSLERRIEQLSKQRGVRRQRRRREGLPTLSIIGYTNAGKSTLLNALTESNIQAANKMFVTLDPTSRRLRFPREGDVIITDTVGFIRNLPPDLLAAFRATLEELSDADLLLHVVDASDPLAERKMDAVVRVLADLKLCEIPRLVVLNKSDLADPEHLDSLCKRLDAISVSALKKEGLELLIGSAERALERVSFSSEHRELHGSNSEPQAENQH
jgi:GTPase